MPILNRSNTERNMGFPGYPTAKPYFPGFKEIVLRARRLPLLRLRHAAKEKARPRPRPCQFAISAGSTCQRHHCVAATDQPGNEDDAGKPDHCFGGDAPAGLLNAVVHRLPVRFNRPETERHARRFGFPRGGRPLPSRRGFRTARKGEFEAPSHIVDDLGTEAPALTGTCMVKACQCLWREYGVPASFPL